MRRGVRLVVLLAIVAALGAGCTRKPTAYVEDVLAKPQRYANKPVVLFGVVSDSRALTPQPGDLYKFKGEYVLSQEGFSITVRTVSDPPAKNIEKYVKGIVTLSDKDVLPVPVLEQRAVGIFAGGGGDLPWPLIGALAVLVALAVVLVVMLLKPKPVVLCSQGHLNAVGAIFCEQCGEDLLKGPETGGGEGPGGAGSEETVYLEPLADLTATDGSAGDYSTPFPLFNRGKQKLGRSAGMDIQLTGDTSVSREHAAIWWEDGSFHIQDMASTGGTFVNGQKVFKQALSDGDVVQLGKTRLGFRMLPGRVPTE